MEFQAMAFGAGQSFVCGCEQGLRSVFVGPRR